MSACKYIHGISKSIAMHISILPLRKSETPQKLLLLVLKKKLKNREIKKSVNFSVTSAILWDEGSPSFTEINKNGNCFS